MPKKNIHPEMFLNKITSPAGEEIQTYTTLNKDVIFVSFSIKNHPAWNGNKFDSKESVNSSIQKFNKRISNLEKNKK